MIGNALRVALGIFSGIIIFNFAFVALCGALQTLFSQGAEKANDNALRSAALPKEAALQMQFTVATLLVKKAERNARRRSVLPKSKINFP